MIVNRIYEWASKQPEKTAIITNGSPVSYRRFAQQIEVTRAYLQGKTNPADGVVVVMSGSLYDSWLLVNALRAIGCTTVTVQSLATADDLRLGKVAALVLMQNDLPRFKLASRTLAGTKVIAVPTSVYTAVSPGDLPQSVPDQPEGGHILYTSGTTGTYKKVLREGAILDVLISESSKSRGLVQDDYYYGWNFPLWTGQGFHGPQAAWHVGATYIFDQRPDWVEHFFDQPVTKATLLPPKLRDLLNRYPERPDDGPPIHFTSGGSHVPASLALEAIDRLRAQFTVMFGATECSSVMSSPVETAEDVIWLAPLPTRRVEIVDEDDNPVEDGTEGIMRVRREAFDATEYMDNPEATARHFRDGCFYPGDLAIKRADGRIRILGRTADVLNVGGQKRAIAPLEQQAQEVLEAEALCLFARQDDGGKPVLLVVVEGDALPAEDRQRRFTALYDRSFDEVRYIAVGAFPRTVMGMEKINRQALLQLI